MNSTVLSGYKDKLQDIQANMRELEAEDVQELIAEGNLTTKQIVECFFEDLKGELDAITAGLELPKEVMGDFLTEAIGSYMEMMSAVDRYRHWKKQKEPYTTLIGYLNEVPAGPV